MIYSRFSIAFRHWHIHERNRLDKLWETPSLTNEGVSMRLRKFANHLTVDATRDGVNITATHDWETYDYLYAADVKVIQGPMGGYREALDLDEAKHEHLVIGGVWGDAIFEPLAKWVEMMIVPAKALYFCRSRGNTWAHLADQVDMPPSEAEYAVFDHDAWKQLE